MLSRDTIILDSALVDLIEAAKSLSERAQAVENAYTCRGDKEHCAELQRWQVLIYQRTIQLRQWRISELNALTKEKS